MKVYHRSKLFRFHIWMIPLGRVSVILAGLSLIPLKLLEGRIDHSYYRIIEFLFFSLFGLWFILVGIGVTLAAFIKCDNCGKRPTVKLKTMNFPPEKPKNEIDAIVNDFYPIEIRTKRFRCIHCGAVYSLQD
jgi:hypothetical protein